jgi:hypothetical protein
VEHKTASGKILRRLNAKMVAKIKDMNKETSQACSWILIVFPFLSLFDIAVT